MNHEWHVGDPGSAGIDPTDTIGGVETIIEGDPSSGGIIGGLPSDWALGGENVIEEKSIVSPFKFGQDDEVDAFIGGVETI